MLLEMSWSQLKTLYEHNMTFVSDACSYNCDLFHALACFYALEGGLRRRTDGSGKNYRDLFVFPSLHDVSNEFVCRVITNQLKACTQQLIPDAGNHLLKLITSRSLRKAATTEMRVNPDLSFPEVLNRGGWASGTTVDHYSCSPTAATLPGGKALSGWLNVRAQVTPPQLSWLGSHHGAAFRVFIEAVFGTPSLAIFRQGETLYPLLEVCAATLVMYHNDFVKDFTVRHPLAQRMLRAARMAFGEQDGALKLRNFSTTLIGKFKLVNTIANTDNPNRAHNQNTALLEQLVKLLVEHGTRVDNLEQTSQNQSEETNMEIRSLKRTIEQVATQTVAARTPSKKIAQCSIDDNSDTSDDDDDDIIVEAVKPAPARHSAAAQQASSKQLEVPKNAFQLMANGINSRARSTNKKEAQEETFLSTILVAHYKGKHIRRDCQWKNIRFDCAPKNKSKYERSMQLMQSLATTDEKRKLTCFEPVLTDDELHSIAKAIEARCVKHINEAEGKTGTSKQRPTYLAFGNRLLALDNLEKKMAANKNSVL